MKIFLMRYYNNNIPLINNRSIYDDIKKSYFGGITEVYRPYGENLYYYDVNSLYPYAALNPMPGCKCIFEDSINSNLQNIPNIFGFFYCSIKTNNGYLGLLPVRSKEGIIMPNGEWSGRYFSEELKFAEKNGYKIFIHKGYSFDRVENVLDDYVNNLYKIKKNTKKSVERAISKSLLNNLLGRFGLDIHSSKTDIVDMDEYNEIAQTKNINSINNIGDKILINYDNHVSKAICDELNVDYKDIVIQNIKNNNEREETFKDVSIVISSAVTSYARIFISKTKLDILKRGGELYYSDTDSIVTNIPLDNELVSPDLGKFELEHTIKRAYFISSKTYCLITKFGTPIIKAKGVRNHELIEEDFISLYKGNKVQTVRTESYRDFTKGYVNINITKPITLDGDAYSKRKKLFDLTVWIDTQPLIINEIKFDSSNKSEITAKGGGGGGPLAKVVATQPSKAPSNISTIKTRYLGYTISSDFLNKYNIEEILISILFIMFIVLYILSFAAKEPENAKDSGFDIEESMLENYDEDLYDIKNKQESVEVKIQKGDECKFNLDTTSHEADDDFNTEKIEKDVELVEKERNVESPDVEAEIIQVLDTFNIQFSNFEAFINNGVINVLELDKDTLNAEEIALLENLVQNIKQGTDDGCSPLSATSTSSSEYERLVMEIRSGNDVTILTPISGAGSASYHSSTATPTSPVSVLNTEVNNETVEQGMVSNENVIPNKDKGKQLVIITKPVLEDENPLPLPNWFEVPKQPDTREKVETWEKDNIIRKFWTSKYPFLSEHYDQIKLSSKELIQESIELQKTDNKLDQNDLNDKYVGLESLELLFGENKTTDLLDKDEDLCLDQLFKEENKETSKSKPSNLDVNKANDSKPSHDPDISPEKYLDNLTP